MKVVILAGGFGTRLSEYTGTIPKPMVPIGGKPILEHIMRSYARFGFKDFIIAIGYRGNIIKNYFKNFNENWKINLIDTGINTQTGGRIRRLKNFLKNETFFLTYGDGLCDVNYKQLYNFHKKNKKTITVTAVRPPARFGSLLIKKNKVLEFNEKVINGNNWINGGFFVVEPEIFKYLDTDRDVFEKKPLEKLAKKNQFCAFKHEKFWQCMDHKIDKDLLDNMCKKGNLPWLN
jgi:glucose-1-phosphate cytidylyltransferase